MGVTPMSKRGTALAGALHQGCDQLRLGLSRVVQTSVVVVRVRVRVRVRVMVRIRFVWG